jgi:hypothetical protein
VLFTYKTTSSLLIKADGGVSEAPAKKHTIKNFDCFRAQSAENFRKQRYTIACVYEEAFGESAENDRVIKAATTDQT